MSKIYAQKERAKPEIARILMGRNLDDANKKADFVRNCTINSQAAELLTPHGIRMFLRSLHKEFKARITSKIKTEGIESLGRKSRKSRKSRRHREENNE